MRGTFNIFHQEISNSSWYLPQFLHNLYSIDIWTVYSLFLVTLLWSNWFTKCGFMSESGLRGFTSPKKYTKSLFRAQWKFTVIGGKFKLSALDRDLGYFFRRSNNPQVPSDLKPSLDIIHILSWNILILHEAAHSSSLRNTNFRL